MPTLSDWDNWIEQSKAKFAPYEVPIEEREQAIDEGEVGQYPGDDPEKFLKSGRKEFAKLKSDRLALTDQVKKARAKEKELHPYPKMERAFSAITGSVPSFLSPDVPQEQQGMTPDTVAPPQSVPGIPPPSRQPIPQPKAAGSRFALDNGSIIDTKRQEPVTRDQFEMLANPRERDEIDRQMQSAAQIPALSTAAPSEPSRSSLPIPPVNQALESMLKKVNRRSAELDRDRKGLDAMQAQMDALEPKLQIRTGQQPVMTDEARAQHDAIRQTFNQKVDAFNQKRNEFNALVKQYNRAVGDHARKQVTPQIRPTINRFGSSMDFSTPDTLPASDGKSASIQFTDRAGNPTRTVTTTAPASTPSAMELGREFGRGVRRGVSQTGALLVGGASALAGAVGARDTADTWMKTYDALQKDAAAYPSSVSWDQALSSPGAFLSYSAGALGEQVPVMASVVATGGVGSLVGRLIGKGIINRAAGQAAIQAADKWALHGGFSGAAAAGSALEAGGIYGEQREAGLEPSPKTALVGGAVSGILESAVPYALARAAGLGPAFTSTFMRTLQQKGLLTRMASLGAGAAVGEGATEAAQEAVAIAARRFVDRNYDALGPEVSNRILQSAVTGAIVGGPFGSMAGVSKPRNVHASESQFQPEPKRLDVGALRETPLRFPVQQVPTPDQLVQSIPQELTISPRSPFLVKRTPTAIQASVTPESVVPSVVQPAIQQERAADPGITQPPAPHVMPEPMGREPLVMNPAQQAMATEVPATPDEVARQPNIVQEQAIHAAPIQVEPEPREPHVIQEPIVPTGRISGQVGPSTDEIHRLAERKGIPWDNNHQFMDLTEAVTGKRHLDDLTGPERAEMVQAIEAQPEQQRPYVPGDAMPEAGESPLDTQAHEAATSPMNDRQEPSEGQREAGNYKLGHAKIAGLNISIENPEGSVRSGVKKDGTPWERQMTQHYGYIRGTTGKDKDHIDVFVKPGLPQDYNGPVYVVDQVDPDTGKYDESKVMMGFSSPEDARQGYLENYPAGWNGLGDISQVSMSEFKQWLKTGKTTRAFSKHPAKEWVSPEPISTPDTIVPSPSGQHVNLIDRLYRDILDDSKVVFRMKREQKEDWQVVKRIDKVMQEGLKNGLDYDQAVRLVNPKDLALLETMLSNREPKASPREPILTPDTVMHQPSRQAGESKANTRAADATPKTDIADPMVQQPRSELPIADNMEMQLRAEKASADLEIVGKETGRRKIFDYSVQGQGGTPDVIGLQSAAPDWYTDLTTGPRPLKRQQIDAAIQKIIKDHGVDVGVAVKRVKEALLGDHEFNKTPWGKDAESIRQGEWPSWIEKPTGQAVPTPDELALTKAVPQQGGPVSPSVPTPDLALTAPFVKPDESPNKKAKVEPTDLSTASYSDLVRMMENGVESRRRLRDLPPVQKQEAMGFVESGMKPTASNIKQWLESQGTIGYVETTVKQIQKNYKDAFAAKREGDANRELSEREKSGDLSPRKQKQTETPPTPDLVLTATQSRPTNERSQPTPKSEQMSIYVPPETIGSRPIIGREAQPEEAPLFSKAAQEPEVAQTELPGTTPDEVVTDTKQAPTPADSLKEMRQTDEGRSIKNTKDGDSESSVRRQGIPPAGYQPISSYEDHAEVRSHPEYSAGKSGNFKAAMRLVRDLVKPEQLQESARRFKGAVFVAPTAQETSGRNAIPAALASLYADASQGTFDAGILQINKPGHTGADPMQRIIARAKFRGSVVKGQRYVLVDDNVTLGGTLAELANYIQSNGGDVAGIVVLTNANRNATLQPRRQHVKQIEERFGDVLKEEFGISPQSLTAPEAAYLVGFRDADALRARAIKASSERVRRLSGKGISRAEDHPVNPATSSSDPKITELGAPDRDANAVPRGTEPSSSSKELADLFRQESADLYRKKSPKVPRIPVAPITGGPSVPLGDMILNLEKGTGKKLMVGKTKGGTAGVYKPGSSATIIKYSGDLDTTAHEMSHALDHQYGLVKEWNGQDTSPFDVELEPFWQHGSSDQNTSATYNRAEGVAEYLRAWMVNPDAAEAAAPKFTAHVKAKLPAEIQKAIKTFSTQIRQWAGHTAHAKIMANVQWETPETGLTHWLTGTRTAKGPGFQLTFGDQMATVWTDRLAPFVKALKYARGQRGIEDESILPGNNPDLLARLFMGVNAKLDDIFSHGMVDSRLERATPGGLSWLLEPLDQSSSKSLEDSMQEVASLMIAQRTIEKSEQLGKKRVSGIGAGIEDDVSVAEARLAELKKDEARYAKLKEAASRYRQWADANLRYLVDKGRLSQEQYEGIKANNEQYVAMQRILEVSPGEELVTSIPRGGPGRKIGSVGTPVQTFKGSTRAIKNPYLSLMDATHRSIREADRNEILKLFRDLLTTDRGLYEGEPNNLATVGREAQAGEQHTIPIFVNGKKESWQFHPDIYKALKGIEEGEYKLPPVLTVLPRILRATIVNAPPFALRNIIRDAWHRSIVSLAGSKPWDTLKVYSKDEISQLKRSGGDQAGHYYTDAKNYARAMKFAMEEAVASHNSIVVNPAKLMTWAKKGAQGYLDLMQGSERQGRLSEYRRAFAKAKRAFGYDDYHAMLYAASQSRSLIDYAIAGNWMLLMNQMIPFSNAAVQGLRSSALRAKADPAGYALRFGAFALAPTLMTYAWNYLYGDDDLDEYRQLPAYQRDLFWNFKLGPDLWLKVPKPFENGVMASSFERMLDYAMGNPKAFDGHVGSMAKTLLPVDEASFAGPYQAVFQAAANYDFFRDRPIVPRWEENLALDLRSYHRASRLGQALQQAIGVDARKIDFVIQQQFGYLGRYASDISDTGRKDKHGLTLSASGLTGGSPASVSLDAKEVSRIAEERGVVPSRSKAVDRITNMAQITPRNAKHPDSLRYAVFRKHLNEYYKAESREDRDRLAKQVRADAKHLMDLWEKQPPRPEADDKIKKKRALESEYDPLLDLLGVPQPLSKHPATMLHEMVP